MAKEYVSPEIDIVEQNGGANTRLPYGLAKGRGIDTTGMTPRQVWARLKGEGVDPKEEYKKLKERGEKNLARRRMETLRGRRTLKSGGTITM